MADFNEEILLRKLKKMEDAGVASAPLKPGYYSEAVADVTGGVRGGVKRWDKSLVGEDGRLRTKELATKGTFWDKAPIVKRTEQARADSMADRMFKAIQRHDPAEMTRLLQIVQGDNWAKGRPVSFDEVRAAAVEILRRAAIDAKKREGR